MKKTPKTQKKNHLSIGNGYGNLENSSNLNNSVLETHVERILNNDGSGPNNNSFSCSGEGLNKVCCAYNVEGGYAHIVCWNRGSIVHDRFYAV